MSVGSDATSGTDNAACIENIIKPAQSARGTAFNRTSSLHALAFSHRGGSRLAEICTVPLRRWCRCHCEEHIAVTCSAFEQQVSVAGIVLVHISNYEIVELRSGTQLGLLRQNGRCAEFRGAGHVSDRV